MSRDALNKPSPQRKLGSMLLIAMDSSFRWDDENRLVQSVPRAMIDVGIAYRSIVSCGSSQLNRGSESAAGESVKEIGGGNWTELSQKLDRKSTRLNSSH